MRCQPEVDDHKERSPELREQHEASGIEALPGRVNRYGEAKRRALDVAKYIEGLAHRLPHDEQRRRAGERLASCGEYLAFRHYYTIDEIRLHAADFCKIHLMCPLCAIRRGAKALQAYLPRYEAIRALRPDLRPYLVTLTVKDGPDLEERLEHLKRCQRELWMRKHRGRGSVLDGVEAAVWSYEVKRGKFSGLWHPHLHMVAMAMHQPNAFDLAVEWREICGDSFIVDVRPIDELDPASGFLEVFKYALKFSDMTPADTVDAWFWLRKRRLIGSAGLFRGIEIPDELLDSPLDDLPYVEYLYRWFAAGYSMTRRGLGREPQESRPQAAGAA